MPKMELVADRGREHCGGLLRSLASWIIRLTRRGAYRRSGKRQVLPCDALLPLQAGPKKGETAPRYRRTPLALSHANCLCR
jgi:hypothetical protein